MAHTNLVVCFYFCKVMKQEVLDEVRSLSTIARSLGQEWKQVKLTSEARETLSGRNYHLAGWSLKKEKFKFNSEDLN